ncbi:MAG: hypothetical protein MJY62_04530, partial [Bacteroidales bacterium]|nr:hypothetical protein [Bacteroidales bacterium]
MKTISKLIALTSVLSLLCQCTPAPHEEEATPKTTTVTASLADLKVSMTAGNEGSLALAWQAGDKLLVVGDTEEIFTLTEVDAADAHKATFEGNEVAGSTFDVYYPADYSALSHDYTSQVQDGNANTDHLVFNAVAKGLTDYHEISFTKVSGAVKLDVVLPEDITAVEGVAITAKNSSDEPLEVFYKTNDTEGEKASMLHLGFKNAAVPDGNHVVTAYMMVSWNPVELAAGTHLEVQAIVSGKGCKYCKNITLAENVTISGGQVYKLDLSAEAPLAHTLSGKGTEEDPYMLWDCEDLLCIRPIIEANPNVYQYFRLACDIDMEGIGNWKPINDGNVKDASGTQFAGRIHFDGNNKTLSNLKSTNNAYTSFFGVLIGSVKDLRFMNPVISATSSSCAVIGGYIGQANNPGKVENVTITGADVSYSTGSAVAAIAGAVIATAEISGVTVSNSTFTYNAKDSNNAAGILFGNQNNKNYTISINDCHSINNSATFTTAPKYLGGVIGYLCAGTISKCSVTGDLSATCNNIGGIVGNFENGRISECRYSGNMTVKDNSGGIAGAQS